MNVVLWICQIVLAGVFLFSGINKSTKPIPQLVAEGHKGVEGLSPPMVRFIGVSELLGAAGMIFPWLFRIFPILTPLAATGLGVVMILAAGTHLQRREYTNALNNIGILALCGLVAVGRFPRP